MTDPDGQQCPSIDFVFFVAHSAYFNYKVRTSIESKMISTEQRYDVANFDLELTTKHKLTTGIKVAPTLKLKARAVTRLGLEGNGWNISHNIESKNTLLKWNRKINDSTKVSIAQFVPNNKWFLVPNPEVKLSHSISNLRGGAATIEASWDTLQRSGVASVTAYAGKDKDYKFAVDVHSIQGPSTLLRAKLRCGMLHSVAVGNTPTSGPRISIKSKPGKDVQLTTTYFINSRHITLTANGHLPDRNGWGGTRYLDVSLPLPNSGKSHPQIIFGIKTFALSE